MVDFFACFLKPDRLFDTDSSMAPCPPAAGTGSREVSPAATGAECSPFPLHPGTRESVSDHGGNVDPVVRGNSQVHFTTDANMLQK